MSSVDVIVPCYHYGHFLRECVESVLSQSLENLRVLIIDDASPDNTAEVAADLVQHDARVTFRRHTANKGHINTYNEGIEWASADYMLLLSADDYLLPGALERSVRFLDAHPEVGFAFGNAVDRDENETGSDWTPPSEPAEGWQWSILNWFDFVQLSGARNIVRTPTAIVRTPLQKRLGGYRAELTHTGDMEMWLRFALRAPVARTEAYQAVYRYHSRNMSQTYTGLLELEQRKAALEAFLEEAQHISQSVGELRSRLLWLLGCDAVHAASKAFNRGDFHSSQALGAFAVRIYPQVKRSAAWTKLSCKRLLGPNFSALLLSLSWRIPVTRRFEKSSPQERSCVQKIWRP